MKHPIIKELLGESGEKIGTYSVDKKEKTVYYRFNYDNQYSTIKLTTEDESVAALRKLYRENRNL